MLLLVILLTSMTNGMYQTSNSNILTYKNIASKFLGSFEVRIKLKILTILHHSSVADSCFARFSTIEK
jgi:uncharacterized membrane protein